MISSSSSSSYAINHRAKETLYYKIIKELGIGLDKFKNYKFIKPYIDTFDDIYRPDINNEDYIPGTTIRFKHEDFFVDKRDMTKELRRHLNQCHTYFLDLYKWFFRGTLFALTYYIRKEFLTEDEYMDAIWLLHRHLKSISRHAFLDLYTYWRRGWDDVAVVDRLVVLLGIQNWDDGPYYNFDLSLKHLKGDVLPFFMYTATFIKKQINVWSDNNKLPLHEFINTEEYEDPEYRYTHNNPNSDYHGLRKLPDMNDYAVHRMKEQEWEEMMNRSIDSFDMEVEDVEGEEEDIAKATEYMSRNLYIDREAEKI